MSKKSGKSKSKSKAKAKVKQESVKPEPVRALPSAWLIAKEAAATIWLHKKLFGGIALIYGLLFLLLAQGLPDGSNVATLKQSLSQVFRGNVGSLLSGLGVFGLLLGSVGNTSNQSAGVYQIVLGIIASLAVIWTLRQVMSDDDYEPRIRDAYYQGMYPLIPFLLVLLVVGIEMIPLAVGSTVYAVVLANGIAVHASEQLFWALIFAVLLLVTLYLLSGSLLALYIVSLQDMTPVRALRSANRLVRHKRWTVLRKLLFMPLALFVGAAIIMVPVIVVLTPLARWAFFIVSMVALTAAHAYMYTLYRELLSE